MIPFPADKIHDEDTALDGWENEFAPGCESLGGQVDAAALVRELVTSLRTIREAALDAPLTLTEAAERTQYLPEHIGGLMRQGKLPNVGRKNAPGVRFRFVARTRRLEKELGIREMVEAPDRPLALCRSCQHRFDRAFARLSRGKLG